MKFGIQLFGILNARRGDPVETLRALRDLGYRRVEPCISLGVIPGLEQVIWPIDWFEAHAFEIRQLGLEIVSAHVFAADYAVSALRIAKLAADHGIRQIVVKLPEDLSEISLHQTALIYMRLADLLAEADAELLIHNEAAEIARQIHGKTAYEHFLSLCLGKVGAQVDVGWVLAGSQDPEALLWRLGDAVKSIHYKDFKGENGQWLPTVIGEGQVDTSACFQFARFQGIPQIIDQDAFVGDPLEDLKKCLAALQRRTQERAHSVSYLNTLDVETGEVRTLRRFEGVIEAPNWLKTQPAIIYNSEGHLFRYDLENGQITPIDTGLCDNCNNDHVIAADESQIAVSHSDKAEPWMSRVYVLPITGGEPRLVTPNAPSYLHGWSPDGREMAYCAFRMHAGKMEVDIYAISAAGGEEKRLTGGGFNDGPEYSPDGQHIWFNSTRTGLMQIWRMNRDGSDQRQMTFTRRNNWFAHVSPDGKKVVYLSYGPDDLEAGEHLPNMRVELWLMNADGSDPHRLLSVFGGQGSINVNSWAADSRHIAFVSYELVRAR